MDYLKLFFIRYFVVICISTVLYVISIQRYSRHKGISLCMIIITSLVLALSVANIFEDYGKAHGIVPLATIFAFLGYILRPVCLYLFIIMSGVKLNKKAIALTCIPLLVNFIIFCLAFIPGAKHLVFFFNAGEPGEPLKWGGGYLRYFAHIISFGYLIWLLVISITRLKAKHFTHSLSILTCALFIVIAVVIESFFNDEADIFLLNATICVSALQYYLFLYTERAQKDALTGLFNRETYYHDLRKMDKTITGIIQFDMNGLKYINDNYGHLEGDKALFTIGNAISQNAKRGMYVYRLGGDEFIVLVNENSEEQIIETIEAFTKSISETSYYCSVGFAYRADKNTSVEELLKEAEKKMYEAKNAFYKNSPFERRKV